ncbi:outer membrane beta-barrel protein [Siphonobacter aquaeclarae]|uniref:Outer membrane protein beta-barrel domain-containing protein n=1 Tax=Siphonobacter aquaeclarae TaxID=563176 RepID=A0A1G9U6G9_9BACT|nr:outer membrane beta-barrel protein [Siphonobacter aquaeclarae]SDM55556.1 Outer membrane protein beta-barrel domain-containing protein [Siphonobacter aquaeclarae]
MRKKSFLVLTFFLLSLSLFAQREADPRWVFRMSVTGTDMNRNLVPSTGKTMLKPAFSLGVSRNIEIIPKMLGVNVGLRYSPRGYWSQHKSKDSLGAQVSKDRNWLSLHYLDVPVDLVVQLGGERTKFFATAGGYFGIGVYGQQKLQFWNKDVVAGANGTFPTVDAKHTTRTDPFKDKLNRLDYGANFGVGFRRGYTVFGITYSQGLADLAVSGDPIRNRAVGLFLSYYFDDAF